MGSRLVFAHMPFPLWCWPSSINKNNSLGGEITVDGWECLKHEQCLHCTTSPMPAVPALHTFTLHKREPLISIELFLAHMDISTSSYHHAWERYWGYKCQGLVPKEAWTSLHQHCLDTLSASALHPQGPPHPFTRCACRWMRPATFCAMKPLLGWPAAQTLQRRSVLRHFEMNHKEHHQYFKATGSPEGQRLCNVNVAIQLWRELALNCMDAGQFVPLKPEARVWFPAMLAV